MAKVLKAKRVLVNSGRRLASRGRTATKSASAGQRKRTHAKKNIGSAIIGLGLGALNPGTKKTKGSSTMVKAKKKNSPAHRAKARSAKKPTVNPGKRRHKRPAMLAKTNPAKKRHPKRNPTMKSTNMITASLYVIGGAVGSRAITQMVLRTNNQGVIGYAGNAVVAAILGFGVSKFTKSSQAGAMVTLGGIVGLVLRMLQDLTPLGNYVNLQLAGAGRRGDLGVGMYEPTTFFVPLDTVPSGGVNTGRMALPAAVTQAAQAAASQAMAASRPAASMSGVYTNGPAGRFTQKGRYN